MDRASFWKLIDVVDQAALHRFDDDAAVQPLIDELAKGDESEIYGFEEQLAQVLHALDGQTHCDHSAAAAGSGDGFVYARCFVVAQGEQHYQAVLVEPRAMPQTLDEWCEALLYVAQKAWAQKTGRDEEEWSCDTSVSYETGSNETRWT